MFRETRVDMSSVAAVAGRRESEVPVEQTIAAQIGALRAASLKAPRAKYRQLLGREAPRWSHRSTLFQKIAWSLQARESGGLKSETLDRIQALAKDLAVGIYAPAAVLPAQPDAPKSERRVYRIG